jgi:hypothetical protein
MALLGVEVEYVNGQGQYAQDEYLGRQAQIEPRVTPL